MITRMNLALQTLAARPGMVVAVVAVVGAARDRGVERFPSLRAVLAAKGVVVEVQELRVVSGGMTPGAGTVGCRFGGFPSLT